MLVDLIGERLNGGGERACLGTLPPLHDICPTDCCLYPRLARPESAGRPSGSNS